MIKQLHLREFLMAAENSPVIDVRTPAEFEQGHIIGAYNIPIFSNEERAQVGTVYKQQGKQAAILLGFELTGNKWAYFIREAEKMAPDKKILVHCWRGGMRSAAMAWAFDMYGFTASTLSNGYKAYRMAGIDSFNNEYPFIVLGGNTGCAKTKILQQIKTLGEQVIDLEDLAQHHGSSFGSLGKLKQPSQEHFENLLAAELVKMDLKKRIWIEDESRTIGKTIIPNNIFRQISEAQVIRIDIPLHQRLCFLDENYGSLDKLFLKGSVERISKRLGGLETKIALQAIEENRMQDFIRQVLVYYDKTYLHEQNKRKPSSVHRLVLDSIDPEKNAGAVISFCDIKLENDIAYQETNKIINS